MDLFQPPYCSMADLHISQSAVAVSCVKPELGRGCVWGRVVEYARNYADIMCADMKYGETYNADMEYTDTAVKSEDTDMPEDLSAKCKHVSVQTEKWEESKF